MTLRPDPAPSSAANSDPGSERLVGKRVHKYEIVRVIGRGGMGTVYEALNTAIGKRVAMKFIDGGTVQNADTVARFQREAQAASSVESAHIVEIFDSGISEEGQPYIVMELLRGEDLGHRIKRCGRLDLGEALHVTAQILRGLHRAHKAGIVHRDLKPDNIFLVDRDDDPNFAKILDFGISKVRRDGETPVHTLTRQGTVLGTPFYMSPEQAQAQPDVDARSDLWSVGAILYECLTGRPPYTGATYEAVIVNICMHDAEDVRVHNPAVPEGIAEAIAQALSRDREKRFSDARTFLDALRQAAGAVTSSRNGLGVEDSFTGLSSSNPGLGPSSSRASSRNGIVRADGAFDPTVRFESSPDASRFSPEEKRRAARRRQQRTVALVAVSALMTGGLGAFVVARAIKSARATVVVETAPSAPPHQAGSAAASTEPAPPTTAPPDPTAAPTAAGSVEATPAPADTGEPRARAVKQTPSSAPTVKAKPAETATADTSGGVAPTLKLKPY